MDGGVMTTLDKKKEKESEEQDGLFSFVLPLFLKFYYFSYCFTVLMKWLRKKGELRMEVKYF